VKWADEIVVVDSFSTDGTLDVCREHGARIVQRQFDACAPQMAFGLRHVASDWTLRVDCDEEVTPELAEEIRSVVAADGDSCNGFEVPRLLVFHGRVLRHGGTVSAPLRLVRTELLRYPMKRVHERPTVPGNVRRLRHHLVHFSYSDYADLLARMNDYSSLASADMAEADKTTRSSYLLFRVLYEFAYRYVGRGGFLDGVPGLMWCVAHTTYTFAKYAKLWELNRGLKQNPGA